VAVILALIGWSLGAYVLPAEEPHQSPVVYTVIAVVTAVLFAGSLLAHEIAQSVVAKRNGVRVRQITLWMPGGVSELDGDPADPGADLWIALVGAFIFTAAGAEARLAEATAALRGMRVRDVMATHPLLAPAGFTVEAFAYVAGSCPRDVFPVVDDAGTPSGVIFADALPRVSPGAVPGASPAGLVAQAADALPAASLAAPDDPATSLLRNAPLRRVLVAVVVSEGRVAGLVTVRELTAAIRQAGPRPGRTAVTLA